MIGTALTLAPTGSAHNEERASVFGNFLARLEPRTTLEGGATLTFNAFAELLLRLVGLVADLVAVREPAATAAHAHRVLFFHA